METSAKILIVGGVAILTYAFLLGFPMAQARMKSPTAPRQLVNTHLEGLMQGAILLGLALAATFSTLPSGLENTAAWLLVVGCAAGLAGGTLNWQQQVGDQFAARPRPLGFLLQSTSGPLNVAGILLMLIGVLKAL